MNAQSQSELTRYYLSCAGLPDTDFVAIRNKIWYNPSIETSFRLRPYGVGFLENVAKIPAYTVKLQSHVINNKHLLLLERVFTSAYCLFDIFLKNARIVVFDDSIATMLLLMDGNLDRFLENNS